jgi:homoaconitase/3-isopropylmalate dehydratase large subunit
MGDPVVEQGVSIFLGEARNQRYVEAKRANKGQSTDAHAEIFQIVPMDTASYSSVVHASLCSLQPLYSQTHQSDNQHQSVESI